ncbi:MAG: small multi-drug export protein, partial [Nanoarchaeota archaeon]
MDLKIIYAIILTLLPISELRGGLPLAISYAYENNIPIFIIFGIIVFLNILMIFVIFYFLDNLHHLFMKLKFYKRFFEYYIKKFQKRIDKFETKYSTVGFLALVLFVAIPLPVTGAWSGCLLAWILDLDR